MNQFTAKDHFSTDIEAEVRISKLVVWIYGTVYITSSLTEDLDIIAPLYAQAEPSTFDGNIIYTLPKKMCCKIVKI